MKRGDLIYVPSAIHISRGSDDIVGGLATVSEYKDGMVSVKELPGHSWNWDGYLKDQQDELKERFGDNKAHPDPDVDTPWIEEGDIVDGKPYKGPPIW